MKVSGLRSPHETVVFGPFRRMLDKIKLHAQGKLPLITIRRSVEGSMALLRFSRREI